MAEAGSWESISMRGLWSTAGLLDLFEITGHERDIIERCNRRESVTIEHPVHGAAVVRDQKPMSDGALEKCLQDDLSPADWYAILNKKVFFWSTQQRLFRLLGGKAYRSEAHDVLTIDTAQIVRDYSEVMTLCPYNSGSTIFRPVPRGHGTFKPIEEYPFEEWESKRGVKDAVVEVAVAKGVPNIIDYVMRVERMKGAEIIELIWEHPA